MFSSLRVLVASLLILPFLLSLAVPVQAQTVQLCRNNVLRSLENIMGLPDRQALHGYQKQLSDLLSTQLPVHELIEEVEQLARDAQLEMDGVCAEVIRLDLMDSYYNAAYGLSACASLPGDEVSQDDQLGITSLCLNESQKLMDAFLESIREYLTRQAVRTSVEPVIQRMRGLNARLTVLISEYARLVNNFFTFSFRLGDTIIGERD